MKPRYYLCLLLSFICLLTESFMLFSKMGVATNSSRIIYVKADASGANNGTSWLDAFTSLTDGLAIANSGDEIWIAHGTYYPTTGTDRSQSFILKNGVSLYGSFTGFERSKNERFSLSTNPRSILSGDIGRLRDMSDNSYHVVKAENVENIVIDYIDVEYGNANGINQEDKKGGGIYFIADKSNATFNMNLLWCCIDNSKADLEGGNIMINCKNGAVLRTVFDRGEIQYGKAQYGNCISINLNNAQCFMKTINLAQMSSDTLSVAKMGGYIYIHNDNKSIFDWQADRASFFINNAEKGGGIALISNNESKANINFINQSGFGFCQAVEGSSIYMECLNNAGNELTLDGTAVYRNIATGKKCYGSFLSNHNNSGTTKITIKNYSTFSNNKVIAHPLTLENSGFGGVIYNTGRNGHTEMVIESSSFYSNSLNSGFGCVIYNDDPDAVIKINRTVFEDNYSGLEGGCIYMNGGSLLMDECYIQRNYAQKSGGAISYKNTEGSKVLKIHNSIIALNKSETHSALDIQASGNATIKPDIFKCGFYENKDASTNVLAAPIGFFVGSKNAKIENGQFINCNFNVGQGGVGAILHNVDKGSCQIKYTNCLFYKNVSQFAAVVNRTGSACLTESNGQSIFNFTNCLFWDNFNLNGTIGKTIKNLSDNTICKPQPILSYCLVPESNCVELDNSVCDNMIYAQDPLIYEVEDKFSNRLLSLMPCSPAINRGNNSVIPTNLLFDFGSYGTKYIEPFTHVPSYGKGFYNNPRIWEGVVDIGAFEYVGNRHEYSSILDEPGKTIVADRQYKDSIGWTHYYNCAQRKLLLSMKTDSLDIGQLNEGLKISSTTSAEYGKKAQNLKGADYLGDPPCDDWYVINRNWQISGAKSINQPLLMRFYFHKRDSIDLQNATPHNSYSDVLTYKITKANSWDKAVKSIGGTYEEKPYKYISSPTTWQFDYQTQYRTNQFFVNDLNGGGSMGIKKLYVVPESRKYICYDELPFRIRDTILKTPGYYPIRLKNANNCDSLVLISVGERIVFGNPLVVKPDNGYESGEIYGYGRVFGGIQGPITYKWSNGSDGENLYNLKAGIYKVTFTDFRGCKDTASVEVKLVDPYQIPNAFTPNNDGNNDYFLPIINGKATIKSFKIYNRVGNMVYNNELLDKGWDGQYKNEECASDLYIYLVELDYGKGIILRGSGEIYLIR